MPTKKQQLKKWVDKKEKEEPLKETEEHERELEKEEDDIYDKEEREEQMEEDEISPGEAGFVEGYEDTEIEECGACKGELDLDNAVEREIDGKTYIFCSKKCAETFEKRKARD
ncbi:MAG: hypothetical protein NTW59_01995 [Candidatus Diapherotrites archaeon]|nr:hypothetical protein [Candidatus Diapherotrites archaeon]